MSSWIDDELPALAAAGYEITSAPSAVYNCVAWAAEDDTDWWSHLPGYYWPARRSPEAEALVEVFAGLGYAVCDSAAREPGYDKVAVYARNGRWSHAARQLENGQWTSKLGPDEDISHQSPEDLAGESYGEVHCIMRRPSAQNL